MSGRFQEDPFRCYKAISKIQENLGLSLFPDAYGEALKEIGKTKGF